MNHRALQEPTRPEAGFAGREARRGLSVRALKEGARGGAWGSPTSIDHFAAEVNGLYDGSEPAEAAIGDMAKR